MTSASDYFLWSILRIPGMENHQFGVLLLRGVGDGDADVCRLYGPQCSDYDSYVKLRFGSLFASHRCIPTSKLSEQIVERSITNILTVPAPPIRGTSCEPSEIHVHSVLIIFVIPPRYYLQALYRLGKINSM